MILCKEFYVCFVLISFCNAVLKTKLKSTVSLKGKRVELKCRRENSSDSQYPIDWSFTSVGSTAQRQFYFNRTFYYFSSLYAVDTDETGKSNLIIDTVEFSYAGNYRCASKTSANEKESYSAELVVLDSDPICKANSVNDSEENEIIVTECRINYRGNAKPRMECTANDDTAFINSTLTINYTDSTYIDSYNTLTNLTSSVMTSSFTIPKAQTTNITCNITFILINSSNIDDSLAYFYLWTYAQNHRSKGNADGRGNENTVSLLNTMIVVTCCLGTFCFAIVLLLLRRNLCRHQKKKDTRHSEPDALLAMQSCEQSVQYDPTLNESTPDGVEDGEERTSDDIRNSSSSNANETVYEKLAEMEVSSPDEQQKMYSSLHIYVNTISTTDYENQL